MAVGLSQFFAAVLPGWNPELIPWLMYGAVGLFILFVLFWMRRSSLQRRLDDLADTGEELSSILNELASLEVPADTGQPVEEAEATEALEPPDQAERIRLSERVAAFRAEFAEVRAGVGKEQQLLKGMIDQCQAGIRQLDEGIAQEQEKLAELERLNGMQDDLKRINSERQHHAELCELAAELIRGAMREVSYQFNRKIRGLVSKTLPLFTENRYEHLQIDEDLTVRVFSTEKHDFMDLEEISSGTQRQIMLAVRLALSQELVGREVKFNQFLFLDEPFAFFDQARTRSSLKVLPSLSEQLNQIWIIGQEFPDDLHFDRHIQCNREYQSLPPTEV